MAGIEKVCEAVEAGCYPGYLMYGYKHNHIQVCPVHRGVFANIDHVLFIFRPEVHVQYKDDKYIKYELSQVENLTKRNGKYFVDSWWGGDPIPVKLCKKYEFCLYVPSIPGRVEGRYYNSTWSIGSTKRRLKRMLKRDLVVVHLPLCEEAFFSDLLTYEERNALLADEYRKIYPDQE